MTKRVDILMCRAVPCRAVKTLSFCAHFVNTLIEKIRKYLRQAVGVVCSCRLAFYYFTGAGQLGLRGGDAYI